MISQILNFIHLAEKLKIERRNGYTSQNIQESVADHCWRVSLLVLLLAPYLGRKIDVEKALKLSVIHDLAEIITGDFPYYIFENNLKLREKKFYNELEAIQSLKNHLPKKIGDEIFNLWKEFEDGLSYESKFVNALDKIEAQVQHNEADFKNWNKHDLKYASNLLDKYCEFDPFLQKFKAFVQKESQDKIEKNSPEKKYD